MESLNLALDPYLIIPYRWLGDPVWAWWLGTFVLALTSVALGELTMRLGRHLNRASLGQLEQESKTLHDNSLQALRQGDRSAYKALNRLANEAFGRNFFLRAALGASSLWPAFLAAGWQSARFDQLIFPLPGTPWGVGWLPAFLALYILNRLLWGRLRRRLARRAAARGGG